jgi:hypothetical protein
MVSSLNFLKSSSFTVTRGRFLARAVAAMIESASLILLFWRRAMASSFISLLIEITSVFWKNSINSAFYFGERLWYPRTSISVAIETTTNRFWNLSFLIVPLERYITMLVSNTIYLPGSFLSWRKDFCHLTGSGIFFLRVPSFAIFSKCVRASFEFFVTRFALWIFGLSVKTCILSLCARRRITSLSAAFVILSVIVSIDRVLFQFQFCQEFLSYRVGVKL